MRIYTVAMILMLMASTEFAGCAKEDDRLPQAVTTAVARDFNEGDAMRTSAHYADDAQILPPQRPAIEGRPAIAAYFQANIDKYIGWGNDTQWSVVRGDIAIEQGVYNIRNVRIGQDVEAGKYVRIWKRINGDWRLYRDMFSSDSALSQAVSVSPEESTPSDNAPPK
jgi:ketosteroid isomerase-like protein